MIFDSPLAVAFYRARHGNRWDRVVAAATGSQFSHCELVFSDETGAGRYVHDPEEHYREAMPYLLPVCFSASPRDGGSRFKRIDIEARGEDGTLKWAVVPMPMIELPTASRILAWCADNSGLRYDWPGVISLGLASVTLATAEVPQWWFCSEICFRALNAGGMFSGMEASSRVTPQRLYDFCITALHLWQRNLWRPAIR